MSRKPIRSAEQKLRPRRLRKWRIAAVYREFMEECEPTKRNTAGKQLIRAIFGTDAIGEDPLR